MMNIQTNWLDSTTKNVILREFKGEWTWDDFAESQKEVSALLSSVEHTVHQIIDFSGTPTMPPGAIAHMRNSGRDMPENRGKSIVVINRVLYQQMYNVLSKVFPSVTERVVIVSTREEAIEEALGTG